MSKISTFAEHNTTLGSVLRQAYQILHEYSYGQVSRAGFTDIRPSHRIVFRYLSPQGSRVADLARSSGMTKQSMAYLVLGLEKAGYLVIKEDPEDGRARRVYLSPQGLQVMEILIHSSRDLERRMDEKLGTGTAAGLKTALEMLPCLVNSDSADSFGTPFH